MDNVAEPRSCPVCDTYKPALLHRQRFQPVAGIALLSGYDVVACESCGCVYADRIPPVSEFDRYYRDCSKYEHAHRGGQEHHEHRLLLIDFAAWIATHFQSSVRLLDMGCGTGRLLSELRNRGFSDLTGLDPSSACCTNAAKLANCEVIQSLIQDRPAGVLPFDVVSLSAVLEHLPDVAENMQRVASWLAPGGSLVIEVPDAEHFALTFNAPYQEFSVEHVNFFSAGSLKNLAHVHGLEVVAEDQRECLAGPGVTGRIVRVAARANGDRQETTYEDQTRKAVENYIEISRQLDQRMDEIFARLREQGTPVHVWGVGTLCQRLVANGRLNGLTIASFVDSNQKAHSKEFAGLYVKSPEQLPDDGSPVIIMSWPFADEIESAILARSTLPRNIIRVIAQ